MTTRERSGAPPANIAGRVPPHDLDAEAAVLSAILLSREALDRVLEILKPEHFYSDANGRIFEAMLALADASTPVDIVSVASYLRDRDRLQQIGGPIYLSQLADATPAVAHVAAHAKVVQEKWRLRAMIATCQRVSVEGYGDVGEVQAFLDGAAQATDAIATMRDDDHGAFLGTALIETFQQIMITAERGDGLLGMPTGLEKLDRKLGGLMPGQVTVIGARPGMGKTALALQVAEHVGEWTDPTDGQRCGAAVFSLEMPRADLARRQVFSRARVNVNKLKSAGGLSPQDWRDLKTAGDELKKIPLWIDDTAGLSPMLLRAKARRVRADFRARGIKLGLVVVDYLQLMNGRAGLPKGASREQEVAECSRRLKEIAKELGAHVIALSQLNRGVEARTNKDRRPRLADLRESGSVEQDADSVVLLYRDDYYDPESSAKGIAELIIAKGRFSQPGERALARFTWDPLESTCRHASLSIL